jgi:hypothetical protein
MFYEYYLYYSVCTYVVLLNKIKKARAVCSSFILAYHATNGEEDGATVPLATIASTLDSLSLY